MRTIDQLCVTLGLPTWSGWIKLKGEVQKHIADRQVNDQEWQSRLGSETDRLRSVNAKLNDTTQRLRLAEDKVKQLEGLLGDERRNREAERQQWRANHDASTTAVLVNALQEIKNLAEVEVTSRHTNYVADGFPTLRTILTHVKEALTKVVPL